MKWNRACLLVTVLFASHAGAQLPKSPSFLARHDYIGLFSAYVAVGDVNGDGRPDIVTTQGTLNVLFGNGNGTFRVVDEGRIGVEDPAGLALADLNGDGKLDLIVSGGLNDATPPFGVGVRLGNGDGTFNLWYSIPLGMTSGLVFLHWGISMVTETLI